MSTETPPTSLIASVAPSTRSGRWSTASRAPCTPPASSSANIATTTSRAGLRPSRTIWRTTARIIASMSFMSTAPRPHSRPSISSPPNGSTDQSPAWAGTTSVCPCSTRAGRCGSAPVRRTTTLARRAADSKISGSSPTSASDAITYSAATRSPGPVPSPKFELSIRNRSWQIEATSSSARSPTALAGNIGMPSPYPAVALMPRAARFARICASDAQIRAKPGVGRHPSRVQAAPGQQRLDPRLPPPQVTKGIHRVQRTAAGEQTPPEGLAVLPAEPPVLLEPRHGVRVQHLRPDVAVVGRGIPAAEHVVEVRRAVPGRHGAQRHPGRLQRSLLELGHLRDVVGHLVGCQLVPRLVEERRGQVLRRGEPFVELPRRQQGLHPRRGHRLAGAVVHDVPGQHRRLPCPHLVHLGRELHEVARDLGAGLGREADVRQQAVQGV